ncbi:MAG: prepilin peptidase [Planctomycetes bacterium]|nr:prepilin peptidase [Planctomycetota bacterium]
MNAGAPSARATVHGHCAEPGHGDNEGMAVAAIAFLLGSFVGSFLNVCIHRLPRNESVVHPPSRCYSCGTHVQWYDNLPIVSWLILRGRCRWCDAPFSIRYLLIELLVGAVTAAVAWLAFAPSHPWSALWADGAGLAWPWPQSIACASVLVLAYFLIVSVFTDLDHMIIPDELTKSMQVAAPFLAALTGANLAFGWLPIDLLMRIDGAGSRIATVGPFLTIAALSLVFLLASLPIAHRVYDRFCTGPMAWRKEDHQGFRAGVLWFVGAMVPPIVVVPMLIAWGDPWLQAVGVGLAQAVLGSLAGWLSLYVVGLLGTAAFKRNAMGFGDVKFLAPIGCFLGPVGVLYAFFAAAIVGTVVGIPMRLFHSKREIPFGPYLAIGAAIVLIWGVPLHHWLVGLVFGR